MELYNADRNVTTCRTGLNIECKTFIRMITYQNKVLHPSQATAASPISRRHCLLYSSLHFSCRKQTNKKKHFGTICLIGESWQQSLIHTPTGFDPWPAWQHLHPVFQQQWEGILQIEEFHPPGRVSSREKTQLRRHIQMRPRACQAKSD